MHRLANPNLFLRLARPALPACAALAAAFLAGGLGAGLFLAPPDYQQGETVRIMYVHVPAAWMALLVYLATAACGAAFLVWKHRLAALAARANAPAGAAFTVVCLISGGLWGQPMWGTWWAWDARLTSVLVLLFFYLGHIALSRAFDDPARGDGAAAILALVGVVNLPVIKFSVDWWNTLHQPASVFRLDGPTIHPSMLWPLLAAAVGFLFLHKTIVILRLRGEIAASAIRNLQAAGANPDMFNPGMPAAGTAAPEPEPTQGPKPDPEPEPKSESEPEPKPKSEPGR